VALLARERREVTLAFQLLVYPMIDDRTATRTDIDETKFQMWDNKANAFGWRSYIGLPPGSDGVNALAAPARFDDLAGLPPAWIGVGTADLFHDESLAYADRLRAAGVACELNVVDDGFHGFDVIEPNAKVSQDFRAAQREALGAALQ
jgi:acetyl esterase/lipase